MLQFPNGEEVHTGHRTGFTLTKKLTDTLGIILKMDTRDCAAERGKHASGHKKHMKSDQHSFIVDRYDMEDVHGDPGISNYSITVFKEVEVSCLL